MLHFEACWVSRIQKGGAGECGRCGGVKGSHQLSLWLAGCLCASCTRLHRDEGSVCSGHIWRPTAASSPLPPFGHRSKQCVPTGVPPPPSTPPPLDEIKQNNRLRNSLLAKKQLGAQSINMQTQFFGVETASLLPSCLC